MSGIAEELREAIIALAGPRGDVDTKESWLNRAARRAGISYRQAQRLYYRECRDPRYSVVERISKALATHNRKAAGANIADIATIRNEIDRLSAQLDLLLPDLGGPARHQRRTRADVVRGQGDAAD